MESSPITSWQIDRETMGTVADCSSGGSKITVNADFSHEIRRRLFHGRKAMINLNSILKGRDITLPIKILLVRAMVFQIIMNGCESWTIRRLSAEELMLLNCSVREDS